MRICFNSLNSEFVRKVFSILSGATVAHAISFFTLPIVTAIYPPEEFGKFHVLLSIITLFSIIGSFKFELAIVIPNSERESSAVLSLSLVFLLITTVFYGLGFFIFGEWILGKLNAEILNPYLFVIVIGIGLAGFKNILHFLLVRKELFGLMAKNDVILAGSSQTCKIACGLVSPSFMGLVISHIAGLLLYVFLVVRRVPLRMDADWEDFKYAFSKHKKFFLYNTPTVLLNTFSLHLPVLLIGRFHGAEAVGYYVLAARLLDTPMGMIGNAVGQVYYQSASDAYQRGTDGLVRLFSQTVTALSILGLFLIIMAYFFSDLVIPLLFGQEWGISIVLLKIMLLWKFFGFVMAPISLSFSVVGKQSIELIVNAIFSTGFRLTAMLLFNDTLFEQLIALSASACVYYIVYTFITYICIVRTKENT